MKKYKDKEWLKEQYYEKERTTTEMADECDTVAVVILEWMERHGLERRSKGRRRKEYALFRTHASHPGENAYEMWFDTMNNNVVRVHRLVAVAEYGFEAVKDKAVHHKNEIPWDNRPENLEPLTFSEHAKTHA